MMSISNLRYLSDDELINFLSGDGYRSPVIRLLCERLKLATSPNHNVEDDRLNARFV